MAINEQLYQLYDKCWQDLLTSIEALSDEHKPTHPLLLKLPNEAAFQEANVKVMVVGKETNDWEGLFGKHNIKSLQDTYADFLLKDTKAKRTLFWRYHRDWVSRLENKVGKGATAVVWNNIYKLGKPGKRGKPTQVMRQINADAFDVFEEELKILKPDIVIFLTGHGYDQALQRYLPGITFQEVPEGRKKQITHCIHPSLPPISVRTYHPQYLNILKPEGNQFNRDTPIEFVLSQL